MVGYEESRSPCLDDESCFAGVDSQRQLFQRVCLAGKDSTVTAVVYQTVSLFWRFIGILDGETTCFPSKRSPLLTSGPRSCKINQVNPPPTL